MKTRVALAVLLAGIVLVSLVSRILRNVERDRRHSQEPDLEQLADPQAKVDYQQLWTSGTVRHYRVMPLARQLAFCEYLAAQMDQEAERFCKQLAEASPDTAGPDAGPQETLVSLPTFARQRVAS